jgi:branched-subunit amino acid aminotransferase/4-amino-4-deoxychorismate lyase
MAATINVNGRVSDQEHAVISVFDHGFLYGEGIYETLRTYNGSRFSSIVTCAACATRPDAALPVPLTDAEIDARFRETMRAAGLGDHPDREAYIRIWSPAASAS